MNACDDCVERDQTGSRLYLVIETDEHGVYHVRQRIEACCANEAYEISGAPVGQLYVRVGA